MRMIINLILGLGFASLAQAAYGRCVSTTPTQPFSHFKKLREHFTNFNIGRTWILIAASLPVFNEFHTNYPHLLN